MQPNLFAVARKAGIARVAVQLPAGAARQQVEGPRCREGRGWNIQQVEAVLLAFNVLPSGTVGTETGDRLCQSGARVRRRNPGRSTSAIRPSSRCLTSRNWCCHSPNRAAKSGSMNRHRSVPLSNRPERVDISDNLSPAVGSRTAPIGSPPLIRFPKKFQLGMLKSAGVPLRCLFTASAFGRSLRFSKNCSCIGFLSIRAARIMTWIKKEHSNS